MFRRIVFSAALSGLAAGLLISVIQHFTVVPMVIEAETYEARATSVRAAAVTEAVGHADHGQQGHSHSHDDLGSGEEWAPADGVERTLYTVLTNTLAAIGFALLLGAGFAVFNHASWRHGLLWGLGGFVAFQLAPALGLPPELPGTVSAEVGLRQGWWLATVIATATGLGTLVFAKNLMLRVLGVALIALPHLIGAPHPEVFSIAVPPEMASAFIIKTLLVGGVFWVVLGGLTGFTFSKIK